MGIVHYIFGKNDRGPNNPIKRLSKIKRVSKAMASSKDSAIYFFLPRSLNIPSTLSLLFHVEDIPVDTGRKLNVHKTS